MKRTFSLSGFAVVVAIILATTAGAQKPSGSRSADGGSLAGKYYPDTGGTPILLSANGRWNWGNDTAGTYRLTNGAVVFKGGAGPAAWGPAVIGSDSLTFTSPGPPEEKVVYRKAGPIPPQLLGVYDGENNAILEFRKDGTWLSTNPTGVGSYVVLGKQVTLRTVTLNGVGGGGAEGWGPADIGNGTLTFHPGGRLIGWNRVPEGTVWVFTKR